MKNRVLDFRPVDKLADGQSLITVIPTLNGERFLPRAISSIEHQILKPTKVVFLDDGSTDFTIQQIETSGLSVPCEVVVVDKDHGIFNQFNRVLEYAPQTDYLHMLHQDDVLHPEFYSVMVGALEGCAGLGMAWCLDQRINRHGDVISVSGKENIWIEHWTKDQFLKYRAELGNQQISGTLLKTNRASLPERFPTDYPILGDYLFWTKLGVHCERIVKVNRLLIGFRVHGDQETYRAAISQSGRLVSDEWRAMSIADSWRGMGFSRLRERKLLLILAARSAIKSKRLKQLGHFQQAQRVASDTVALTGTLAFSIARILVAARDRFRRHGSESIFS